MEVWSVFTQTAQTFSLGGALWPAGNIITSIIFPKMKVCRILHRLVKQVLSYRGTVI